MKEINNNINKQNQMINEILKKSVNENSDSNEKQVVIGSEDTIPVKNDVKAIMAKQVISSIKDFKFNVVGCAVKDVIIRKRFFSISRLLFFFVALPTLFVFLYYNFFASPMYISLTKFSVKNTNPTFTGLDIGSLLVGGNGAANSDNFIVLEYLNSLKLGKEVDDVLQVKKHFSNSDYDLLSRLSKVATNQDFMKYWLWVVSSSLDTESGVISLEVKAYTPEMAQQISKEILLKCETLINRMNDRLQNDTLMLAQKELEISQNKVKNAQLAMRNFREKHSTFDPEVMASGMQSRVGALEAEQTKLQTELNQALLIMKENAPQVKALKVSLEAVKKQLAVENAKIASAKSNDLALSSVVAEYEGLVLDLKFAQEQQVTAMKALEVARVNQMSQSRYLVSIQEPTLPDESLYPKVYLFTFYTFCATLLGLALVSLIVAAVREHTGF